MIAGGTDVATVAGILGHSQPSTTLDIYTHAFDKNKKAASAGLQEILELWRRIVPLNRKALRRKGLVGAAQISAILEKNLGSLVGQDFRDFSR